MNSYSSRIKRYALEKKNQNIQLNTPQRRSQAVDHLFTNWEGTMVVFTPDFWDLTKYDLDIEKLDNFLRLKNKKLEIIAVDYRPDESAILPLMRHDDKIQLYRLLPCELYAECRHVKRKAEMPTFILTEPSGYYYEISQRKIKEDRIESYVNFGENEIQEKLIHTFNVLKKFSVTFKPKLPKKS